MNKAFCKRLIKDSQEKLEKIRESDGDPAKGYAIYLCHIENNLFFLKREINKRERKTK